MRHLVIVLCSGVCLGLFGCAGSEPPIREVAAGAGMGSEPVPAETPMPEPVDANVPESRTLEDAGQTEPGTGQSTDEQGPQAHGGPSLEPARGDVRDSQTQIRPDLGPVEVNSPTGVGAPGSDVGTQTKPAADQAEPNRTEPAETSALSAFYDQYASILASYVREEGLVDYGGLKRRRLEVKSILAELDELDPNVYESWSSPEKLAFWINAYNLKMLDIIARNYPIESSWWVRLTWPPSDIRHIAGIWTDYRFIVMEEEFTLTDVEQRFLHRTFGEPRAFLALTYAAQSGPPLRGQPYRSEDLDRQLDEQVKRFLSGPCGIQIDRGKAVVRLSAFFKPSWRGKEFVARYGTDKKFKSRDPETRAVLSFITRYLPPGDVEYLEVENYALEYLNFDWRLNDTSKGY